MEICNFKALIEPDEAGGYVVECPQLKGCYSQGETLDEAMANIQEVIDWVCALMSEPVLAKDWNRPEEEAWAHLQPGASYWSNFHFPTYLKLEAKKNCCR